MKSSSSDNVYTLAAKDDLRSLILIGKIFAIFHLFVMAAVFGVVWNNLSFLRGYPRFGSPPIPGNYFNDRFSFQFAVMASPILGLLMPYILLMIFTNPLRKIWSRILFWYAAIMLILMFLAACILFVYYCGFIGLFGAANSPWNPTNMANDDRYCCVHYITNPTRCRNVVDCPLDPQIGPTPLITQESLKINTWWLLNWAFIGVQLFFATGYLVLRASLKEYVSQASFF